MNWMARASAVMGVMLIALSATQGRADSTIAWTSNFEAARAQAQAQGKMILVNIHATWCIPCKKLQAGTLSDAALGNEIMQSCVPVSLDADQDEAVIRQWPITGFPTQLFLAPDGRVVNSIVGNVSVDTYRLALFKARELVGSKTTASAPKAASQNVVSKDIAPVPLRTTPPATGSGFPPPPRSLADSGVMPTSSSPAPVSPVAPGTEFKPTLAAPPALTAAPTPMPASLAEGTPTAPSSPPVMAPPAVVQTVPAPAAPATAADANAPLALGGFCPVTMLARAELVKGAESEFCVHKSRKFHFVSPSEKNAFLANPKKYLPSEEGFCVVTWAEGHRREAGSIEYPALFGDYLFLFANDDTRQKFLRDPERYVDGNGRAHRIPLHTFRGDRENIR